MRTHGLLPLVEIKEDTFDKIWGKVVAEFKAIFLTMLPVTPHYFVVVSCPDNMKVYDLELELQIRGYVATKHTSSKSC